MVFNCKYMQWGGVISNNLAKNSHALCKLYCLSLICALLMLRPVQCALLRRVYAVMLRSLPCPGLITNVFFNYLIFNNLLNYW